MTAFVNQLQEQLEEKLLLIDQETNNPLQAAEQSFMAAGQAMSGLQDYIRSYSFTDKPEEIYFFKEVEPSFHAQLIYYARLYRIERRKPVGGKAVLKNFMEEELKKIYLFFRENEDFYQYHRSGAKFLDNNFYSPDTGSPQLTLDEYTCILNTHFCTVQGYKTACIIALEKLQEYLTDELAQLDSANGQNNRTDYSCKWTGSKAALIELMYALIYGGMINNGQIEVRELAACLESVFQVSLGNYYRTKQEIYTRKNPTAFLDLLKKRLREGMDAADDKYRS